MENKREQRDRSPKESVFQRKLLKKLRAIPNSWFTVKEAKALRGLPDIIGIINGRFIGLECKRSLAEASHNTGRIVLQKKVLRDIEKVGGYSALVYPENEKFVLEDLIKLCHADV